MANPSGSVSKAPLQLGKLSPEDAERLASMFRPAWELDDAPFAQGSALSSADMDALAAPAGVAPEVAAASADKVQAAPRVPPAAHRPVAADDSVVIDVEPPAKPPPPMRPPPPTVKAARDAAPRPAQAKAAAESDAYVPIKKSNTGVFLGIGGVVAILAVVGIGKAMSGGKETPKADTSASTASTETTNEGRHIPPPPPVETAAQADTTDTAQAAPTQTAKETAPPPAATTAEPAPTHKATPPPVVTHTTTTHATTTTHTAPATHHTKPPTHSGSGAIVRDNPF